jgi:UDP-N-acetyl-D-mannosaminuronic acid transferase (WecB/TagA/CpsF family)
MKKIDDKELLFDLNVFGRRRSSLLSIFEKWLNEAKELHVVYTPNPEQIIQSRGNHKFKQALKKADLLLPDGVGLVWASNFLALFGLKFNTNPSEYLDFITFIFTSLSIVFFLKPTDVKSIAIISSAPIFIAKLIGKLS